MPENILEEETIDLVAILQQGELANVTFVLYKDGEQVHEENRNFTGKRAFLSYKTPTVDQDKDSYTLTAEAKYDGEVAELEDEYIVWPAKGKLKVVDEKEKKPLKGFPFRIMQGGKQTGKKYTVNSDDGSIEFKLRAGHTFTIQAISPYEIKKETKVHNREIELEAVLNFEAEFIEPDIETLGIAELFGEEGGDEIELDDAGRVKQFVNLPTKKDGRDGLGTEVKIKVGVKGDRDKPDSEKIGKADMEIYIKATFGPDGTVADPDSPLGLKATKSKRTDASFPTELVDAEGITSEDKDKAKVYKGKVKLKADGTAEFKVKLGLAGGDTCKVEIGSTDAYDNASMEFANWRKLYYEIVAPNFMSTDASYLEKR